MDVEVAVGDGSFGYPPKTGILENDRWDVLAPMHSCEAIFKHFPALRALGLFLDNSPDYTFEDLDRDCGPLSSDSEPAPPKIYAFFSIHRTQLRHICGSSRQLSTPGYTPLTLACSLHYLRRTVESCYRICKGETHKKPNVDDIVDDLIVWRYILMYTLFWTAPDSSMLRTSGVWDQIVPIL